MPDEDSAHTADGGGEPLVQRFVDQWPLLVVLLVVGAGLLVIAFDHFRRGALVLSASVVLALVLRAVLPKKTAGMLRVRSRLVDLLVLGALALGLTTLSLLVPPPS
jgi:hypothetical protein